MSDVLNFVFQQVRVHHVKIEGDFVNIAVGLMLIEGMGRKLEPKMDLLKASVPFLKEALHRRMAGEISRNEEAITNFFKVWWRQKLFQT